jgi:hypothetical protein
MIVHVTGSVVVVGSDAGPPGSDGLDVEVGTGRGWWWMPTLTVTVPFPAEAPVDFVDPLPLPKVSLANAVDAPKMTTAMVNEAAISNRRGMNPP